MDFTFLTQLYKYGFYRNIRTTITGSFSQGNLITIIKP